MYPLIIPAIAAEQLREEYERTARIRLVREIRLTARRARHAARRRTSQIVPAMSSAATASSQPPSVSRTARTVRPAGRTATACTRAE
ncbi:MAG TPA: hypothetical protein VF482_11560 [Trebonia sp.]